MFLLLLYGVVSTGRHCLGAKCPGPLVNRSGECAGCSNGWQDELRGGVLWVAPEEPVAVQMEEEHRKDEEDDEGAGEQEDYRQKAGLVGG